MHKQTFLFWVIIFYSLYTVDGTTNNLDKYIQMRTADVPANAQDSLHGMLLNEYGVVVSETMFEWFFAQIHQ